MKKKSFVFVIIVLLVFVLFVAYAVGTQNTSGANIKANYTYFIVNGKKFTLMYVAKNQSEWDQGLMNKSIGNSTTELFVFPRLAIYPFWMYDTYSNLDMIWINGNESGGKVVYIASNVPSCFNASVCAKYTPTSVANFVLEANAGFVRMNNITIGTEISFG